MTTTPELAVLRPASHAGGPAKPDPRRRQDKALQRYRIALMT